MSESADDDYGVPIPGRVLPREQWARTAIKRMPEDSRLLNSLANPQDDTAVAYRVMPPTMGTTNACTASPLPRAISLCGWPQLTHPRPTRFRPTIRAFSRSKRRCLPANGSALMTL